MKPNYQIFFNTIKDFTDKSFNVIIMVNNLFTFGIYTLVFGLILCIIKAIFQIIFQKKKLAKFLHLSQTY